METPWIEKNQLKSVLQRIEAFWSGNLDDGPLVWATAPDSLPGKLPVPPVVEAEKWTDVRYVMEKAEYDLSHTFYSGDAFPMHNPWLGPDHAAAWLGADITFAPR